MDSLKEEIRKQILAKAKNLKEEERRSKSLLIKNKLFGLSVFKKAKTIMFYMSKGGEVDTTPMIKEAIERGKKVAVPIILTNERELAVSLISGNENELEIGLFGVKQPKKDKIRPINLENIDLVVVPGLAFDSKNNRLGRGGGYYDRFLKKLPNSAPTVGLAFDFQIVENLPVNSLDVKVQTLLTS
jgi:5-formyltetrahydrofolate cyclo-ligase